MNKFIIISIISSGACTYEYAKSFEDANKIFNTLKHPLCIIDLENKKNVKGNIPPGFIEFVKTIINKHR